jgi:hypothetical protein
MSNKECEHYPPEKDISNEVFVVSPFGYPFDEVFENVIKKKGEGELRLKISRADLALQLGYVMCQRICRKIIESEFILVDISNPNPNVYYEAGLGYSMRRGLIFLANENMQNAYRFGLNGKCDYYLTYRRIDELKISEKSLAKAGSSKKGKAQQKCLQYARKNPCLIPEKDFFKVRDRFNYFSQKRIVIFENSNAPLVDFHSKVFQEITAAKIDKLLAEKSHDKSEYQKLKFFKEHRKNWKINVVELNQDLKLNDLVATIKDATICIIDTTQYQEKVNPYIFFCLGLAHGFEREVIPITNRQIKTKHPFDTRGLWHIFYSNKKELKDQFLQILPSIFWKLESAKDNNLVKKLWDPFFNDKKIGIFTCARDVENHNFTRKKTTSKNSQNRNGSGRGKRTNIDKFDYKTVTEFSYFIVQNYQNAEIRFDKPRSKKNYDELQELQNKKELERLIEKIKGKTIENGDCIIVGSADVNDYTEVNLAAVHKIESYYALVKTKRQWDKAVSVLKKKAFIFEKPEVDHSDSKFASTFYQVGRKNAIHWYGDRPYVCTETPANNELTGTTYGVLTIADNPFVQDKRRKIMVLSGFTGIATYGISQLLTSRELRKKLMAPLVMRHKIYEHDNVNILIQVEYKIKDIDKPGDTREIKTINIKKVEDCPDLGKFL